MPCGHAGSRCQNRQVNLDHCGPPNQDRPGLLDRLAGLATHAGAAILSLYESDCRMADKSDSSPVTAADHAAEAVITAGLRQLTPSIDIVAEEAASREGMPACPAGAFWLVDPLDGTREFIARNGEFTVNIALIEDGVPTLGVVLAPALGVVWAGGSGLGAWRQDAGGRRPINVRVVPPAGLTVLGSRSHADDAAMKVYLEGRTVAGFRAAGSSLKFCLLAEGEADLYPRFGRTMEWDTAAGHAVLLAAGGGVCTLDGHALRYGKAGFENPHFVASGGGHAGAEASHAR